MSRALRLLTVGAVCGAAWGVTARVWMRLITSEPEFTWGGTLFIIAIATLPGLGMGVVLAARGKARAIGIITVLPLGLGAGMVMLPTILLGGFAVARRPARPAVGAVLAGLAVLVGILLVLPILLADLSLLRAVIGFVMFLGLAYWMAAMLAVSLSPGRRRSDVATVPVGRSALVG